LYCIEGDVDTVIDTRNLMLFGEYLSIGIAFSIVRAKPICSKKEAIRAKPPHMRSSSSSWR